LLEAPLVGVAQQQDGLFHLRAQDFLHHLATLLVLELLGRPQEQGGRQTLLVGNVFGKDFGHAGHGLPDFAVHQLLIGHFLGFQPGLADLDLLHQLIVGAGTVAHAQGLVGQQAGQLLELLLLVLGEEDRQVALLLGQLLGHSRRKQRRIAGQLGR
jgi:hypothetical protein